MESYSSFGSTRWHSLEMVVVTGGSETDHFGGRLVQSIQSQNETLVELEKSYATWEPPVNQLPRFRECIHKVDGNG